MRFFVPFLLSLIFCFIVYNDNAVYCKGIHVNVEVDVNQHDNNHRPIHIPHIRSIPRVNTINNNNPSPLSAPHNLVPITFDCPPVLRSNSSIESSSEDKLHPSVLNIDEALKNAMSSCKFILHNDNENSVFSVDSASSPSGVDSVTPVVKSEYTRWLNLHKKKYARSEFSSRVSNWFHSFVHVNSNNQKSRTTYTQKMYGFSDLTQEEFAKRYLGRRQSTSNTPSINNNNNVRRQAGPSDNSFPATEEQSLISMLSPMYTFASADDQDKPIKVELNEKDFDQSYEDQSLSFYLYPHQDDITLLPYQDDFDENSQQEPSLPVPAFPANFTLPVPSTPADDDSSSSPSSSSSSPLPPPPSVQSAFRSSPSDDVDDAFPSDRPQRLRGASHMRTRAAPPSRHPVRSIHPRAPTAPAPTPHRRVSEEESGDDSKCKRSGGRCGDPSACTGTVVSGFCPGSEDNKCCIPNEAFGSGFRPGRQGGTCTSAGGRCGVPSTCGGRTQLGLCPGSNDNVCCFSTSTPTPFSDPIQPEPLPISPVSSTSDSTSDNSNNSPSGDVNFDLRSKPGVIGRVHFQGRCGSCWSHASNQVIESSFALQHGKYYELSPQYLIDCTYNQPNDPWLTQLGCEGGIPEAVFEWAKTNPLSLERSYPYVGNDGRCKGPGANPPPIRVSSFTEVSYNEQAMKDALHNGPLQVSIYVGDAFQYYFSGVLNVNNCPTGVNHAILLVGYGEDSQLGPYWIGKNSWGENWGEKGYFRIIRGKNMCGIESSVFSVRTEATSASN